MIKIKTFDNEMLICNSASLEKSLQIVALKKSHFLEIILT
jgi:hypothetical protein